MPHLTHHHYLIRSKAVLRVVELSPSGRITAENMSRSFTIEPKQITFVAPSCDDVISSAVITGLNKQPYKILFGQVDDTHQAIEVYRGLLTPDSAGLEEKKQAFVDANVAAGFACLIKPIYHGRSASSPVAIKMEKELKQVAELTFDYVVEGKELPEDMEPLMKSIGDVRSLVNLQLLNSVNALNRAVVSMNDVDEGDTNRKSKAEKKKELVKQKKGKRLSTGEEKPTKKAKVAAEAAKEPANWAQIKKEYGWDPEAKWFEGREVPTQRGQMRMNRGGRKHGSTMNDDGTMTGPDGSVKPKRTNVNIIKPTPAKPPIMHSTTSGEVAQLQEELKEALAKIEKLTSQNHTNMLQFAEWIADDAVKKQYAQGRDELYRQALANQKAMTDMYHGVASASMPALPAQTLLADIPEFNWKWESSEVPK